MYFKQFLLYSIDKLSSKLFKSILEANERLRRGNKKRDTGISLFLLFFTNHLLVN